MYDSVVKFDTYRNLQRHRAVLRVISRLSCLVKRGIKFVFVRFVIVSASA